MNRTAVDVIRASFVARFGEEEAARIEDAAQGHYAVNETLLLIDLPGIGSAHGDDDFGSSPFRYWFLMAISYECVGRYRDAHGIQTDTEDLRNWAIAEGKLAGHDGSVPDYLGLLGGLLNPWLNPAEIPE